MKNLFLLALLLLISGGMQAQSSGELTIGRRINLAARQRMLSQRMAKDYVYLWRKVNEAEARVQLAESIRDFEATLALFQEKPLSGAVPEKLATVQAAWKEYKQTLSDPALPIDIQPFLKRAGEMLTAADALVKEIEKYARSQPAFNAEAKVDSRRSIINVLGRQRMLSQRITALYAAYEANPSQESLKNSLLEAIRLMQEDWVAIQQFTRDDPDGLSLVTGTPEFREMVVQRKAFEAVLEGLNQNKRTELLTLWTNTNALVEVLDKVVLQAEILVEKDRLYGSAGE